MAGIAKATRAPALRTAMVLWPGSSKLLTAEAAKRPETAIWTREGVYMVSD